MSIKPVLVPDHDAKSLRALMESVDAAANGTVAEGEDDNFTIDDIKRLEQIKDFATLKAQAKQLIKGKPARRMKPEKISWFYNHIDELKNPMAVIKMMYDLLLAGEGHKVIGSKHSMGANAYRQRFGEEAVEEADAPAFKAGDRVQFKSPRGAIEDGVVVKDLYPGAVEVRFDSGETRGVYTTSLTALPAAVAESEDPLVRLRQLLG